MADITNAQIVVFCNERCRTLADEIERVRRTCEVFANEVVVIEALAVYSGAANEDLIDDGSDTDGRKRVTKAHIGQLKFVAEQLVSALTTDDREQLVNNWVTNSRPMY